MDEAHNKRLTAKAVALAELLLADVLDEVSGNEAATIATAALGNLLFALVKPEQHEVILAHVQDTLRRHLALGVRLQIHGPASDAPAGHA